LGGIRDFVPTQWTGTVVDKPEAHTISMKYMTTTKLSYKGLFKGILADYTIVLVIIIINTYEWNSFAFIK
jgi:hypothetical protein